MNKTNGSGRCIIVAAAFVAGAMIENRPAQAQQRVGLDSITFRMQELVQLSNPELGARRAALAATRSRALSAGFAPPAVFYMETEDASGLNVVGGTIRFGVEREFLTGGRRAALRSFAESAGGMAEAAVEAARRSVTARVEGSLAEYRGWTAVSKRLAAEDSLLGSVEESLRDRFASGDARYVDVLRLRTERLRVQAERAQSMADALIARGVLDAIAGPDHRIELKAILDSVAGSSATTFLGATSLPAPPSLDSLLALSPEVRFAEAGARRIEAAAELLRAEQRPRFAAGFGGEVVKESSANRSFAPAFTAQVSLPFTAARANRAARSAVDESIRASHSARLAARSRVAQQLSAAYTRYEAARQRIAAFDAALLRGAREERESALAAYRNGQITLLEMLDFERALARAEIDRIRAHIEAASAYAELLAAGTDVDALSFEDLVFLPGEL